MRLQGNACFGTQLRLRLGCTPPIVVCADDEATKLHSSPFSPMLPIIFEPNQAFLPSFEPRSSRRQKRADKASWNRLRVRKKTWRDRTEVQPVPSGVAVTSDKPCGCNPFSFVPGVRVDVSGLWTLLTLNIHQLKVCCQSV